MRAKQLWALAFAVFFVALTSGCRGCAGGGRVAIARALVLEPNAVLLDEPLSNLDIGLRDDLLAFFGTLFREYETTVVYVTHDPWEARQLGDRVAVMDEGRIVFTGHLDDLAPGHESAFVRSIHHYLTGR